MKVVALALAVGAMLTVDQRDEHRTNLDHAAAAVSEDGNFVAFTTYAQLVAADNDSSSDVYVFDRVKQRITFESADTGSVRRDTIHPGISGDGRFIVFDRGNFVQLRDRSLSATMAVGSGNEPVITQDASHVVFSAPSVVTAVGPDRNGPYTDVYSVDVRTGQTRVVSVDLHGMDPTLTASNHPTASRDGRYVAFASRLLADGGRRHAPRVFVRDTLDNTTKLVGDGWDPSISGDGRFVAFVGVSRQAPQIYLADLGSGETRIITTSVRRGVSNGAGAKPQISADGRFVAYQSVASDLAASDDFNLLWDVFVFDQITRTTTRVSGDAGEPWMEPSGGPSIDGQGAVIAFSSRHPTGASDKRNDFDLYVATLSRGDAASPFVTQSELAQNFPDRRQIRPSRERKLEMSLGVAAALRYVR